MADVTISSPNSNFTTFTLVDAPELPQEMRGRLTRDEPVQLMFRGGKIRTRQSEIEAVAVPRYALVNGQPDRSMDGYTDAMSLDGGYLVTLALDEAGTVLTKTGILVIEGDSMGPGGPTTVMLQLTFYPMSSGSRLYASDSTYESVA